MTNGQADVKKVLAFVVDCMRERRRALGLSQEQLAERADLSTNYVSKIEIGPKVPSLTTTIRLAQALGMEVSVTAAGETPKWMDEAQAVAMTLRSLPDAEAEFMLKQFRTLAEHLRGLL